MKVVLYVIIAVLALLGVFGLHAYFLNQSVCGANAVNYDSFYELDMAKQWIVDVDQCSIGQPVTIGANSTQHDIVTQPNILIKIWYLVLQVISKLFYIIAY